MRLGDLIKLDKLLQYDSRGQLELMWQKLLFVIQKIHRELLAWLGAKIYYDDDHDVYLDK
jgi:hypothetical protein